MLLTGWTKPSPPIPVAALPNAPSVSAKPLGKLSVPPPNLPTPVDILDLGCHSERIACKPCRAKETPYAFGFLWFVSLVCLDCCRSARGNGRGCSAPPDKTAGSSAGAAATSAGQNAKPVNPADKPTDPAKPSDTPPGPATDSDDPIPATPVRPEVPRDRRTAADSSTRRARCARGRARKNGTAEERPSQGRPKPNPRRKPEDGPAKIEPAKTPTPPPEPSKTDSKTDNSSPRRPRSPSLRTDWKSVPRFAKLLRPSYGGLSIGR